jgi:hypothetical protein
VWLGLKNSDDQGTRFDLRAEVLKNGSVVVAVGEIYNITGVTRNAANAKEVSVPLAIAGGVTFNGASDTLSLRLLTRIGTDGAGQFAGGHSNAVGVRAYFDATNRDTRFGLVFGP